MVMRTLLDERYAPITSSIGFLELPLNEAAAALEAWRRSLYGQVAVARPGEGFPEVLGRLEPLTAGAVPRELLVNAGKWTAYFDNSLRGTDPEGVIGHLTRELKCQGLEIEAVPHTIGQPGIREGRSGGLRFRLYGPLSAHFLNYVRTVSVIFDGSRWVFNAIGTKQVFEDPVAYHSRKVRDRFTSEMLERYCQALELDVFNPATYGPDAVFFENDMPMPDRKVEMTLAETQRWLEITPGMAATLPG